MEALAAFGPAVENVEMLALVVVRASLWRQFEMGGDYIGDVDKRRAVPVGGPRPQDAGASRLASSPA